MRVQQRWWLAKRQFSKLLRRKGRRTGWVCESLWGFRTRCDLKVAVAVVVSERSELGEVVGVWCIQIEW